MKQHMNNNGVWNQGKHKHNWDWWKKMLKSAVEKKGVRFSLFHILIVVIMMSSGQSAQDFQKFLNHLLPYLSLIFEPKA